MSYDLRHLRYLVTLADTGNFSRAAEIIGITQPALSRSVATFEADIGFPLFDRSPSGAKPTIMGAAFLKEARKLLLQARQLETNARALSAGEAGTLSFGTGPLLASLLVPNLLIGLAADHPRLRILPLIASAREMVNALADHQIELCLYAEQPMQVPSGVTLRRVGSVPLSLMARAGHPLAGRHGLTLADIARFPLATGTFGQWPANGLDLEPTITCDNFHILREVVLRSDTVWISSPALAPADAGGARLVELDVAGHTATRRKIVLARMHGATPSRAGLAAEARIKRLLAAIA